MKKFVVPVVYVNPEDNDVMPEVVFVMAEDAYEALDKCKQYIFDKEIAECPEDPVDIWHWQAESEDEGYVLGDPVQLVRLSSNRDELWDKIKAQVMEIGGISGEEMDDDSTEDLVNRKTDEIYESLFGKS